METSPDQASAQPGEDEAQTEPTATRPLKTRRDCTILGMKVYAIGMASCLLVSAAPGLARAGIWDGQGSTAVLKQLLAACVIGIPPTVFFGALVGFELYRLAAGSIRWRDTGCLTWIVCLLFLTYVTLPLYLAYRHRRRRIEEGRGGTWWLPLCHFLLLLYLACALSAGGRRADSIAAMVCGGFLSLFLSDSVVVNIIAQWRNEGRLAAPVSHKFQYSLGTLLIFVLGLGAWLTALVKMCGG